MKIAGICIILLFNVLITLAQPPESFRYQAVARDNAGNPLTNKNTAFRISILKGSATAGAVYIEDHQKTTNGFGLVDLEIGKGNVRAGTFSSIEWGKDVFFIKVEMDPQGGVAFQHLGTSQLLSVPYALNAKTVEVEKDGDPLNEIQQLSVSGSNLALSKGGGTVTLPEPQGDKWGSQYVITDSTLSGTGTISSVLKIARQDAQTGDALLWNGSTWNPGYVLKGLPIIWTWNNGNYEAGIKIVSSPGTGIIGKSLGTNFGLYGESVSGTGVGGKSLSNGYGVLGESSYIGVKGISTGVQDDCIGIFGESSNGFAGYFKGKVCVSGRIGIKTEQPEAGLHIKGKGWPESFAYLESESGQDAGIRLYEGGNKKWQIYSDSHSGPNGLHFVNGAGQSCMFINQSNTNVGIGSYSPSFKLDVAGAVNLNSGISWGAALHCNGAQALWYDGTYFSWGYGGTYNYFADKVTIGNAANPGNYMLYVQGNAFTTGTWSTSDMRFKKDIREIESPLGKVMNIRGVTYEYRTGEFPEYRFSGGRHAGCIAQEIEKVLPEAVLTDNNGYKSLNYSELVPLLLEAVKEQQNTIERMRADFTGLKTRCESTEKENRLILERLANLETMTGVKTAQR